MENIIAKVAELPTPSSEVMTEALALMSAFGTSDKKLKKDLADLLEVQKHNEDVLQKNIDALKLCQKTMAEQEAAEKKHQLDYRKRMRELSEKTEHFEREYESKKSELRTSERRLLDMQAELKRREKELVRFKNENDALLAKLNTRETEIGEREIMISRKMPAISEIVKNAKIIVGD